MLHLFKNSDPVFISTGKLIGQWVQSPYYIQIYYSSFKVKPDINLESLTVVWHPSPNLKCVQFNLGVA